MQRPCVTPPLGSFAAAGFACFLLAACGSPTGRGPSPADETARAQNQAGTRSLASGNLTGALAQYRSSLAVAESVENFELAGANLLNIAVVHERLGQWNESHAAADKILSAPLLYGSQTVTGAAARKAFVHLDQGDATAALRWADAAERDCAPPARHWPRWKICARISRWSTARRTRPSPMHPGPRGFRPPPPWRLSSQMHSACWDGHSPAPTGSLIQHNHSPARW